MSSLIQFVANYDDLSTDKGFQFKFHRDKCRNGYLSRFQPNTLGIAGSLLDAASRPFGGLGGVENAAYQIQQAVGGKAHDTALEAAVAGGRQQFKQCTRCGHWVCPDACWNHHAGLCQDCAPDEQEELRAQQAPATREQDYTQNLDFLNRNALLHCPNCQTKLAPGPRFCPGCGTAPAAQTQPRHCPSGSETPKPEQKVSPQPRHEGGVVPRSRCCGRATPEPNPLFLRRPGLCRS